MKPIDQRADVAFMQALRCVEYRVPRLGQLKREGYLLSVGLRYGMVGVATSHHLLITADDDEEQDLLELIRSWPQMVEEHARWDVLHRLPVLHNESTATFLARVAAHSIDVYFPMYRRLSPLDSCLAAVLRACENDFDGKLRQGWNWFRRGRGAKCFHEVGLESAHYARHFFERRQADLDEVPEIALIGE